MRHATAPLQQPLTPELLTVEQFAQRLQVSRATVFVWLHKNIFAQGKHYLKIGRVLRFIWSCELLETLQQVEPVKAATGLPRQKKCGSLNWDY